MVQMKVLYLIERKVSRQNLRYYSAVNPHWMRETHNETSQKGNVKLSIIVGHIIGATFIKK